MLRLSAAVHKKEMEFDEKMEQIFLRHPYFGMFLVGIVAPIMVVAAVALFTCILALPMGLIFGWM